MASEHDNSDKTTPQGTAKSFVSLLKGLQFKWTILLTVSMFVLAVVGEALIRDNIESLITAQQIDHTRKHCALLATEAMTLLNRQSGGELSQLARRHNEDPNILYVEFFTKEGQRIAAFSKDRVQPPHIDQRGGADPISMYANEVRLFGEAEESPPYLDMVWPALVASADSNESSGAATNKELIGYVRIGVDLSGLQDQLVVFLQNARYAGILTILAMIPLAFMIVRRVTSPIDELSQVVNQLSQGDFRVRTHIKRSDEVGQLAGAFNTMADELAASNDGLVKLNAELEDRVLQRTRQLKELAARDPLTGLYNRRHLSEVLIRRFSEAERYNNDLSCMMIDLDNFKNVNDQFGHEMGDTLLMLTATTIGSELRGADVGARFGGDEFCVLLPQTSAEQAQQVGIRILERFKKEVKSQLEDKCQDFGISVGVAGMQELELVHPDELTKAADQALYSAKDCGKNQIRMAASIA